MSTTYLGLNYFPQSVNFYEEDAIELAEAKYGIKADGAIGKLICKIFKEGYYIEWGNEQAMIFARRLGGEVSAEEMDGIIQILLDKNFFNKEMYEKFHILTSAAIQKIWNEATSRRKKNLDQLPYLLIERKTENVNNLPVQTALSEQHADNSGENACNFQQSKVKQSIVKESIAKQSTAGKEEESSASLKPEIPKYAHNPQTHNLEGLISSLRQHNVTNPKEVNAILRLSDFGRKHTQVWITLASTNWSRITAPGKFLISELIKSRSD